MFNLFARAKQKGVRIAIVIVILLGSPITSMAAQAEDAYQWAPIAGRPELGAKGIYGTQGVPGPKNRPGVREGAMRAL